MIKPLPKPVIRIGVCPLDGQPILQQIVRRHIINIYEYTRFEELHKMINLFRERFPYIHLSKDQEELLTKFLSDTIFKPGDNVLDLMKDYILSQQNPDIDE